MWEAVISGLTLGFILAISVGPVIFTVIKQSLNNGRPGGFSFIGGVWLSDIVLVFLSNAFSELVTSLMAYSYLLGIVGSFFLIFLGVYYVFFKKIKLHSGPENAIIRFSKKDMAKIFTSGFLINTLNPNVFLFWLGTATTLAGKFDFGERIVIFSVCLGLNFAADVLKVLMAGKLRHKLTIHSIAVTNKISGTILIGFGIALLVGTIYVLNEGK